MAYYSTSQAAALTGASQQTVRAYTKLYERYFSNDATPSSGQSRRFTSADLRLIKFCHQLAEQNITREQVAERLAGGELERFDWWPPEPQESTSGTPEQPSEQSAALVPVERLQAAHALMLDAQKREQQAAEQVAALQAEVQRLSLELGKAQGAADVLKAGRYRAPRWWRAIFGGRQGE